jgi:1-acylglycerone phosphate reductase
MFDVLRLELAPFGVKTVTVVTGPVKSLVHTNTDMWKMPVNSRYSQIEDTITKRSTGDDGAPRMDTMRYAEGVVSKLLSGGSVKFWYGENVGIIKWLASWLPTSFLVSLRLYWMGR